MRDDQYDEDSEIGANIPAGRTVNNYYQSRNGNGNGLLVKILIALCGFTLVLLVGMQGFMWRAQLEFQADVIDRLARLEERTRE